MDCFLLTVLLGICPCSANLSTSSWAMTCGGTGDDFCRWGSATSDGGYILTGFTNSFGANDILLVKVDALGSVTWAKTVGGANADSAFSAVETSDGGFILSGWVGLGTTDIDGLLIKLNSAGSVAWAKTFGNAGALDPDRAYLTIPTSDGGYLASGHTYSGPSTAELGVTMKLNALGTVSWVKLDSAAGSNGTRSWSVKQTSDGGYIVSGYKAYFNHIDVLIKKIDALGNITWKKNFGTGTTNWDLGAFVNQTSDGGYIVAGYSGALAAAPYFDALIIKLDNLGGLTWIKTYGGGTNHDVFFGVNQVSDGGYIAAGYTRSYGAGGSDVFIVRLNASGNVVWAKTFGGAGEDYAYSAWETSDGRFVIIATTNSFGAGGYDFMMIKLESDGTIIETCSPLGTCSPTVTSPTPAIDEILTTFTFAMPNANTTPGVSSATVTENTVCGVISIEQEIIETPLSASKIAPSPATNKVIITYAVKKDADVLIKVYSETGMLVRILVDKKMGKGLYTVTWDGTDSNGNKVPAGSYFCIIKTNGTTTRKMVYLR